MVCDGPADDASRGRIQHDGAVHPALTGAVLCHIHAPQPIRPTHGELAVDQIRLRAGAVAHRAAPAAPPEHSLEAGRAHQAGHTFSAHPNALAQKQFRVHPRRSVGTAGRGMDVDDHRRQLGVGDRSCRQAALAPVVEPGGRHPQHPAGQCDGKSVSISQLGNHRENYFGRLSAAR